MKAVGGASEPGGGARLCSGGCGAGEVLDTAEVGEKRDRQERATRGGVRGQRVPALVVIGQVTQKRQRKMTDFHHKKHFGDASTGQKPSYEEEKAGDEKGGNKKVPSEKKEGK